MTSSTRSCRRKGAIGVLEAEPFFAPELQRQCAGEPFAIQAFRKTERLADLPVPRVCLLVIEPDHDAAIRFIQSVRHDPGTACVVVVAGSPHAEWMLRDIGAVSVMDRFIRGDELAAICRKLLKSLTQRERTPEDHV